MGLKFFPNIFLQSVWVGGDEGEGLATFKMVTNFLALCSKGKL